MNNNQRRWDREPVTVPCTVSYEGDKRNSARASILNLSAGGLMISAEQGFIANERVSIALEEDTDALLFEFAEIMTGTVRWSQALEEGQGTVYHIGIALERKLPHRIVLTEQ